MAKSTTRLRNLPLRPLLDAIDEAAGALRDGRSEQALRLLQKARRKYNGNCFSFRAVEYPAHDEGNRPRRGGRKPGRG
jgi:hypothetical protein